ncbi:PPE family protein [Mycobacterium sp.]|uniref:PPE family protein n=1 Tax=Mycobacterium sp. TaxID=1785 RepID=UPI003C7202A2
MDFGMLPPEVTSALIHSGPGSGSLIVAAGVWQQLSLELEESVGSHVSALASLSGAWNGPAWTAMDQAVEPYLDWLRTTAEQCQQIGTSVQAVAVAFEITHFTVVHPVQVSANRTRLAVLLATNWFGINLPAIAETEAEYEAMWVNNSAAMYRYAATSASAVLLPQFSSPPPIANPVGLAAQASVAPANTAAAKVSTTVSSALAAPGDLVNNGWFQLANNWGNQFIASGFPVNLLGVWAQLATAKGFQSLGGDVGAGLAMGGADLAAAEAKLVSAVGSFSAPRAALGVGVTVGKLMAPPSVVGLLPASQSPVQLVSAVSPLPSEASGLPAIPMSPMRPMPPKGSAGGRRRDGRDYDNIEYGSELLGTVMQRPPSAG